MNPRCGQAPRPNCLNRCRGGVSISAWLFLMGHAFGLAPSHAATPVEEAASFRLADPQLTIELVAAEPDLTSPVAIAWDAAGRLFVAEMPDYPNAPGGGQIRLLEDRDGDGHYERVTIFADQLPFPNSVLPWNGGILVTAAPDLWFLMDVDGDGRADERRVLFTGFNPGNQQLRANGLVWGLDNWVYGANGRSDGEVRSVQRTQAAPVSLRNHDFRFRPDTGEFEAVAGRSQFGLGRDDWGQRFLSWNTIPIRHEVLPERALNRNRYLVATDTLQDLLEPGDDGSIFPLTAPPLTFNQESTSHFNALAGLCVFRGDALGPAYYGNAFVGESLRNLVHRRVLEPAGPTFVARRPERSSEFLASTDPWFHPVNFAAGPDGALYVVDFYRRFVEHPDFVHGPARDQMPWQAGAEHGRLWRIHRRDLPRPRRAAPSLAEASSSDLTKGLDNANGWVRDTAQRLLFERQDRGAVPALKQLAKNSPRPQARVQALYALDGLAALTPDCIRRALRDPQPRVRENAIRLSRLDSSTLRLSLRLTADPDARVRFELALAIGDAKDLDTNAGISALVSLAIRDATNRWHAQALLSSVGAQPFGFFREFVRRAPSWLQTPTLAQGSFLESCGRVVGASANEQDLDALLHILHSTAVPGGRGTMSVLAGLADGLARTPRPLRQRLTETNAEMTGASQDLSRLLAVAVQVAGDSSLPTSERLLALRVAQRAGSGPAQSLFERLLLPDQPVDIQTQTARGLGEIGNAELIARVLSGWGQLTRATRREVAMMAVRSKATASLLLNAIQTGGVRPIELDGSVRQSLLRHTDTGIRTRAEKMLQMGPSDRGEIVQRYQPALKLAGDRGRGAAWFGRNCLLCHSLGDRGQAVGPDLAGISSRPVEAILEDVLDPSRQVTPDFVSYSLVTKNGETWTGLVAAENSNSVTLRRAGQPDETIGRDQVREWRAETKSLMPEGLEQGMSVQDMADLLAFLREPEARLLPSTP